jgi:putative tryptophan/tyrosine transport system substrate-binding protein
MLGKFAGMLASWSHWRPTPSSAPAVVHRSLIITLAARHRLPAIFYRRAFVDAGGLISYGYDVVDQYRRSGG